MSSNRYDICIISDHTGSMSPCITRVKNNIKSIVKELFEKIPGVRISIGAFQDYNDDFMWKAVDFTVEQEQLIYFVENLRSVEGISGPAGWRSQGEGMEECYEYALYKVQELNWYSDSMRSLIIVGDAPPHSKEVALDHRDWEVELQRVKAKGINIYSVLCNNWGDKPKIKNFFRRLATETNGYNLYLDQFAHIIEMMMAICFKQMGQERLETYENELRVKNQGMTTNMRQMFDVLLGRQTIEQIDEYNRNTYHYTPDTTTTTTSSSSGGASNSSSSSTPRVSSSRSGSRKATIDYTQLTEADFQKKPCAPSRFQVLDVTSDVDIKTFANDNGLVFSVGKGFYEFNKPELIQKSKEIILQEKSTGNFFEGLYARKLLNLIDYDEKKRIKPTDFAEYNIFVQSTSATRKLVNGSKFLYDQI